MTENFISVTEFSGTDQEVVTLYFYADEEAARQTFMRICGEDVIVRRAKVVEERIGRDTKREGASQ